MPDEIVKGMSSGFIEERLQSITQQVLSREKLLEIIQQYGLYGSPKDDQDVESAIRKMREDISVRTIKAEDLDKRPTRARYSTVAFTLSYQGKDPETVQQDQPAGWLLIMSKRMRRRKNNLSLRQRRFCSSGSNSSKSRPKILARKLNDFKRQHAGELPESISFNLEQIYKLNAQLEEVNGKIGVLEDKGRGAEGQFGALGNQGSSAGSQPASDPWTHLAQLRMQLFNLRAKYSEKHPDVIKTRNEIQQLEGKLGVTGEQNGKAAANAKELELKKYTKQRDEIQRKIAEFTRKNQMAPLLGTEYTDCPLITTAP